MYQRYHTIFRPMLAADNETHSLPTSTETSASIRISDIPFPLYTIKVEADVTRAEQCTVDSRTGIDRDGGRRF
jgi:hypothetical protein